MAEAQRCEVVGVWKLVAGVLVCADGHDHSHSHGHGPGACVRARLTWWMISLRMSMGRSNRFSGPFTALSLPLVAGVTCSVNSVAFTAAGAGALGHIPSASPCMAGVCASSCAGESERALSASKGMGDAVLGVPGDESGESAMVMVVVVVVMVEVVGRAGTA